MRIRRFTGLALGGLALSGILATAGPAAADYDQFRYERDFRQSDARQRINDREVRQHNRIQHGFDTGLLTPREFDFLRRQQANIRQMERQYLADGRLSQREWRQIEHAQDQANNSIEEYMRNGEVTRWSSYR